jgi:hypothetical protein
LRLVASSKYSILLPDDPECCCRSKSPRAATPFTHKDTQSEEMGSVHSNLLDQSIYKIYTTH